jgi:pimeloyl-ACP methyl ester carboxylesterase
MTKRLLFGIVVATVFGLCFLGLVPRGSVLPVQARTQVNSAGDDREHIRTIDHFVPHISTVPANAGEQIELFVRERVRRGDDDDRDSDGRHRRRPVVLMVHGSTQSTAVGFDLRFENYSWMAFLARAGFDVFAMDQQGYGSSARPTMDDPCNASDAQQKALLIPNPLPAPCTASYPFNLTTSQSDWDEIDTVVDYMRRLRDVGKVSLIGWSLGGPRTGGYAARHPEKVERLVQYAPLYNRQEPTDPPNMLPEPGVPLQVRTIASAFMTWDGQVHCENQFVPAVRDAIRSTILEFDPLGSTWGTEDLWRSPVQNTRWGWNAAFAEQVQTPTLVIRGDLDMQAPEADVRALFADLGTTQKVFVHVACAAHQLVWETQHMILLRASSEWLRHGTFVGHDSGSFAVDADGTVHEE